MSDSPIVPALRVLPARANLEHLKNEAKQRLKTMRLHDSAARLSEAQLLVARLCFSELAQDEVVRRCPEQGRGAADHRRT